MNAAHYREIAEVAGLNAFVAIEDGLDLSAYTFARLATHYANLMLERERIRDAPALTIFRNSQLAAARQANTLRCDCGGKLKRKLLRRELVGVECARCGRYVAAPAQEVAEETTTKEEAA